MPSYHPDTCHDKLEKGNWARIEGYLASSASPFTPPGRREGSVLRAKPAVGTTLAKDAPYAKGRGRRKGKRGKS